MSSWLHSLSLLAVIAYALLAEVFLAFLDLLLRALSSTDGGAAAMQSINREVFRIVFMMLFLAITPISFAFSVVGWTR